MTKRFMSAADFRAALVALQEHGISGHYQLPKILECGNNQPGRWAKIGAPRYVALAIAAILQDIPPWTRPTSKDRGTN